MIIRRLAITTGDIDGVGFEVSAKALHHIGQSAGVQFTLFRDQKVDPQYLRLIDKRFIRITVKNFDDYLLFSRDKKTFHKSVLFDVCTTDSPAHWVVAAATGCLQGIFSGLITAPLSKTLIHSAGIRAMGHTEILKRVSSANDVRMAFLGRHFNVILATDHIPLNAVAKKLDKRSLVTTVRMANVLRQQMGLKKPICLLGLNPHAGESGLLGADENSYFQSVLKAAKAERIPLRGPVSPDAAFLKGNWKNYSFYIACYHDQGLIPFKLAHGQDSGVHLSLGLPFVRTSVDHGTAKDIFGKNCANPSSMIEAIQLCKKLTRN